MESAGPRPQTAQVRTLGRPESPARRIWLSRWGSFLAATMLGASGSVCGATEVIQRRIRFSVSLGNPLSQPLGDQRLWLYLPVSSSPTQRLIETRVSGPHRLHADSVGHTVLELYFERFPPLGQKVVAVSVDVELDLTPRKMGEDGTWLGAERFIEIEDPAIASLAAELHRPDPWQTARAIFEWVSSNLTYAGYLPDDYGALYALTRRRGDCTEYAYLAVALARACRIPARMVGGYVMDRDATPRAEDYHNWAEVHIDGTWRLVDAQKGNWLTPCDQYVAFRYHRGDLAPPLGSAHRFRVDGQLNVRI